MPTADPAPPGGREVTVHLAASAGAGQSGGSRLARLPAVPALPRELAMLRALRPLRGRVPARRDAVIDEVATAHRIAEDGLWLPTMRPAPEHWLDLALIVDDSASMIIWRQLSAELGILLRRIGAFRDIRLWWLDGDRGVLRGGGRSPRELIDPAGRRLVMVVSDCIGEGWAAGPVARILDQLGRAGPVVVLQPLPQRLWSRCRIAPVLVRLRAARRGMANSELDVALRDSGLTAAPGGIPVPVVAMEPRWITRWSRMVAANPAEWLPGAVFFTGSGRPEPDAEQAAQSAMDRVARFRAAASPTAFHLATCLAAAPLNLPVMRLVQRAMLPVSRPAHLAEVFLGGILHQTAPDADDIGVVAYEFHDGVRELLLASATRTETLRVLRAVSDFLGPRLGAAFDFLALLRTGATGHIPSLTKPFAAIACAAMRAVGGEYAEIADKLEAMAQQAPGPLAGRPRRRDAQDASGKPDDPGELIRGTPPGGTVTAPGSEELAQQAAAPERVAEQPAVWGDVPPRNPNFTGREELLLQLRRQLQSHITAVLPHALHGLGGVGKTQLAVEYAYRFATDYELVWWVPAAEIPATRSALADLAPNLDLPTTGDMTQRVQSVREALRQGRPYRRWLVVFDNADKPDDILPYCPYPSGHVLITSRNQDWLSAAQTLEVDIFSRAESIQLIRNRGRGISAAEADRLAEALGDLPIAVEQASAWQAETGMSVDEYLGLIDERISTLLSERSPNYPLPVVAAWQLAFDELAKQSPASAQLLELCAFIGPEPVSFRLLSAGRLVPQLPAPLSDVMRDDILLGRTIRELGRYALARIEPSRRSLQLHRLVQGVLRERLSPAQRSHQQGLVHAILAAANPGDPDDINNWDRLADIGGHVTTTGLIDADPPDARRVVLDQIRYRYVLGDYESSRELGEATVLRWWQRYGPDDELTLIALRHLGNTWRALGMLDVARAYNNDTLTRMRRVFGEDHEHTLFIANSYGADLRNAGDYAGARRLDEENYARHQQLFGDDDLFTLRSANNLAVDLRLAGDFRAARELDEYILERRRRVLGDDHPDTLYARIQLSRDIRGLGDNTAALRLQERTLPLQTERLGPGHLNVLSGRLNHAVTLRRVGRLQDARAEAEQCLDAYRRTFGEAHAGTVAAMWILADILRTLDAVPEAVPLAARAFELAGQIYAADHIFLALYANNYAIALRAAQRYDEARPLDENALTSLVSAVGTDHPYTVSSTANTATSRYFTGDGPAARELSEQALELLTRIRGGGHAATAFCLHNLAMDARACGDEAAAEQFAAEALDQLRAMLGSDHPDVVSAESGHRYDFDIEPPAV